MPVVLYDYICYCMAVICANSLYMVVKVMMGLLALPALIIWYKKQRLIEGEEAVSRFRTIAEYIRTYKITSKFSQKLSAVADPKSR